MPTDVHFIGAPERPIRLREDYDTVVAQFERDDKGHFTGDIRGGRKKVTVYRSAIAYLAEANEPSEPLVAKS